MTCNGWDAPARRRLGNSRERAGHVHEVSSGTPGMPERPLRDTQAALREP
jgi:hypothetical protein